jgi:phosphoribosyl 1,2-cyclic phosphate phosphodiesterase
MNFEEALETRSALDAKQTWFTHFSDEVDHEKAEATLPKNVALAYDGLKLDIESC